MTVRSSCHYVATCGSTSPVTARSSQDPQRTLCDGPTPAVTDSAMNRTHFEPRPIPERLLQTTHCNSGLPEPGVRHSSHHLRLEKVDLVVAGPVTPAFRAITLPTSRSVISVLYNWDSVPTPLYNLPRPSVTLEDSQTRRHHSLQDLRTFVGPPGQLIFVQCTS